MTVARFAATLLGANYVKGLVVDGSRVFVSGANMSSGFFDVGNRYWDVGYRFDGAVGRGLRKDFAVAWSKGQEWRCGAAGHEARALPFPTAEPDSPQAQAFLTAVNGAKKIIRVQSPNLNEPLMVDALVAAVRRGVEVDLLLSKEHEQSGESLPGRGVPNDPTLKATFDALGPSACKGLHALWFSRDGRAPVKSKGAPPSHVKYLAVDDQVTIMGSANQDVQSWRNSREVNVVVDAAALAKTYREAVFAPV